MGLNIAGLIIKEKVALTEGLESILASKLTFTTEVDFDDAASSFKERFTDVIQNEIGTLVLTTFGELYDLSTCKADCIQFMISDVSATYYVEQYSGGNLIRKFIISEGEIAEDIGEGLVGEDDDISDKVWDWIDEYLALNGNLDSLYEGSFKRYEMKYKYKND